MNNRNSGYSSSNQGGGYSSSGSQQIGGGGYSSSNQGGPSSGGYQSSGGYHSSGNHQQITYSTQTPSGFFYNPPHQHTQYVTHQHYDEPLCCTIV